MKETEIQWHPGFVAAMDLELESNREDLKYEKEYNLNTKPLEIDLLIIRKKADMELDNEIGRIFRGHNIIEYKSPADHLDVDVYYKVTGYACLYKSYGETVDAVSADDITVTLMRESKPEGLLGYLEEKGCGITRAYEGIYYIQGKVMFPTQIVVTGEMSWKTHMWLKALSGRLERREIKDLLERASRLDGKRDRELADAVLEVSIRANKQVMEEMIGDESMSEALMEMMAPLIEPMMQQREEKMLEIGRREGRREGKEEGREEGIQGAVSVLRDLGHMDGEIRTAIARRYGLSLEEAEKYMKSVL